MLHKLTKTFPVKINKPLVPLKITLFCWFAAAAVLKPFVTLHLKQLGLTLKNLSIIYTIVPAFLLLGPAISGVIADKLGQSKPVLLANLFLVLVASNSMLFIPSVKSLRCGKDNAQCHTEPFDHATIMSYCNHERNVSNLVNCTLKCSLDTNQQFNELCFQNNSCGLLSKHYALRNLTWPLIESEFRSNEGNITVVEEPNVLGNSWCLSQLLNICNSSCKQNLNATHEEVVGKEETEFLVISGILLIVFLIMFSNCYRIIDVTAMSMIKTYNSDFGRQRFWSILGVLIFAPLSGYFISLTSPENGPQKYETAFYFFDAMILLTMTVVWKLEVKMEPPSKDMFQTTLQLLRNPDVIPFLIVVFVIGTTWGFVTVFSNWYLQDLNAPSSLIGLIPAVSSIAGLPFLLTSKWFVSKAGSSNLLIAALMGYVVTCSAYSFLRNPWWSLLCEVFGIVTYHLLWVTVVTHSHEVAPAGLTATTISVAGGIHYGIGMGSGSLIGGSMMNKFGARTAYRVMAAICLVAAVLYASYVSWRRRIVKRELDMSKSDNATAMDSAFHEKFTPQMIL